MFVDTHAHLYTEEFDHDRDAVVERALEAGVTRVVLADIDASARPAALALADRYPDVMIPLLGIHPTSIRDGYKQELAALEKALTTGAAHGIGECGIDLYWDTTYYKEQCAAFEWQLHLACEAKLPVIIHSRESLREVCTILERQHYDHVGIFHCFPGDEEEARRVIDLGFFLGIGGIVTFKNAVVARVVRHVGLDRIVLETDAPYLAPTPHRGKRNESCFIPIIAEKVAELTGHDVQTVANVTTRNALDLFSPQSPNP